MKNTFILMTLVGIDPYPVGKIQFFDTDTTLLNQLEAGFSIELYPVLEEMVGKGGVAEGYELTSIGIRSIPAVKTEITTFDRSEVKRNLEAQLEMD